MLNSGDKSDYLVSPLPLERELRLHGTLMQISDYTNQIKEIPHPKNRNRDENKRDPSSNRSH